MLCVLSRHPDSKVREQLLHHMYNITKKPDRNQRLAILSGCVGFAKLTGQNQLENELLPQLWEQVRLRNEVNSTFLEIINLTRHKAISCISTVNPCTCREKERVMFIDSMEDFWFLVTLVLLLFHRSHTSTTRGDYSLLSHVVF